MARSSSDDATFPELDPAQLAMLEPYGQRRSVAAGDILYAEGDAAYDFFVVLSGLVDIIGHFDGEDVPIAQHGAGRFLGELNLLTGQRVYLTARVAGPGRVLCIPPRRFRELMSTRPELSDTVFRAFVARREFLRSGEGAVAIRIIGSRYSP